MPHPCTFYRKPHPFCRLLLGSALAHELSFVYCGKAERRNGQGVSICTIDYHSVYDETRMIVLFLHPRFFPIKCFSVPLPLVVRYLFDFYCCLIGIAVSGTSASLLTEAQVFVPSGLQMYLPEKNSHRPSLHPGARFSRVSSRGRSHSSPDSLQPSGCKTENTQNRHNGEVTFGSTPRALLFAFDKNLSGNYSLPLLAGERAAAPTPLSLGPAPQVCPFVIAPGNNPRLPTPGTTRLAIWFSSKI